MTKPNGQIKAVNLYYDRTRREYNMFWGTHRNAAMHFGYFDKDTHSHDEAVANLNKQLVKLIDVRSRDYVLDAGSGLGGSAFWLAENTGCRVLGTNIVDWQNTGAKNRALQKGLSKRVNFINADYANTGLPSKNFTVFWGIESIVHAVDKQSVIKEAYRLLKPGGRILISEYVLEDKPMTSSEKKFIKTWLEGWAMPGLMTASQYQDQLIKAGFKDIQVVDWTSHVKPSLNRLRHFVWAVRPFKKLLRLLNLVDDVQIKDYEASRCQIKALDKSLWKYKVITGVRI